jgi:hypothetical protein
MFEFDAIDALEAGAIFAIIGTFAWWDGRPAFAYIFAAFSGVGAAIYTIRNGFNGDAVCAWALVLALLVLGFVRGLMPTKP